MRHSPAAWRSRGRLDDRRARRGCGTASALLELTGFKAAARLLRSGCGEMQHTQGVPVHPPPSPTYTLKICSWPSWELLMPRASWSGFLRLSLVSCPIYLSPATTRAKPVRLHQAWRPAAAHEPDADELDRDRDTQITGSSTPWLVQPEATARAAQGGAPTRIA